MPLAEALSILNAVLLQGAAGNLVFKVSSASATCSKDFGISRLWPWPSTAALQAQNAWISLRLRSGFGGLNLQFFSSTAARGRSHSISSHVRHSAVSRDRRRLKLHELGSLSILTLASLALFWCQTGVNWWVLGPFENSSLVLVPPSRTSSYVQIQIP